MRRKQILFAINDPAFFKELIEKLQYFGFETNVCLKGREAIEYVNSNQPDMVLAELDLADRDGIELCWLIRETSRHPAIPFILLTNQIEGEIKINGLRSGVDAFIEKHAPTREIVTHIEALFKRVVQFKEDNPLPVKSLAGIFPDFSLLEILQLLNMSKKSGTLKVFSQKATGRIGLLDGNLTWAELNLYEGEDAVTELVGWKKASFEFEKDLIFTKKNITRPTMEVLLNCSNRLDEINTPNPEKPETK